MRDNYQRITGRLTRDPDFRRTQAGNAVASFSIAVNRKYADGSGTRTDYFTCVAWKELAEAVYANLSKGSKVTVQGYGQFRKYTNKDKQEVKVYEVIAEDIFQSIIIKDDSEEITDEDIPF